MPSSLRSAATQGPTRSRLVAGAALTCAALGVVSLTGTQAQAATRPSKWGVSRTTTTKTTTTTKAAPLLSLPSGQSVVGGLLSGVAGTFDSVLTGWTAYGPTTVLQTLLSGHNALGALAITSAGPWTGATSPSFAVTAGQRYSATGWFRGTMPATPSGWRCSSTTRPARSSPTATSSASPAPTPPPAGPRAPR